MPKLIHEGTSEHRLYRYGGFAVLGILLLILPFILPDFQVGRVNRAIAIAIAVLGLNLVVGYSGLLALCQSAFIAVGAFITGTLVVEHNWDYWMTIPFAMFGAFVVGLLLGVPALRIKGLYLAMSTVAFAAAFPSLTKLEMGGIARRTGGANGLKIPEKLNPPGWVQDIPLPFGWEFTVEEPAKYRYFLALFLAVVSFWAVANFIKSRPGRAVVAIRDNETGAAVSGVNLRVFKVLNFGFSAALGGLAGVLYATNTGFVSETSFTFILMVDLLVALVIGGVATISGPIIGALVVVFVREFSKNILWEIGPLTLDGNGPLSQAFFGVILIVVVFFAPQGIIGAWRQLKAKFVRVIPAPPQLADTAASLSVTQVRDSV